MPTTNTLKTQGSKPKGPPSNIKTLPNGKSGFIATGPKLSKVRTTKITNFPTRRRPLDPEERKKLVRLRWKKAIRKVKAMLRFNLKIVFKDEDEKAPVQLAPTYKMTPDPGKKFNPRIVEEVLTATLKDRLEEYEYSRFTAPKFAKVLSSVINDRVKELDFPRYKFVTNVMMTENSNQGMDFTSRCVWDTKTDGHATAHYKKGDFIAVASVHGVYLD